MVIIWPQRTEDAAGETWVVTPKSAAPVADTESGVLPSRAAGLSRATSRSEGLNLPKQQPEDFARAI
jgi:hypothetical protein